MLNLINFANDTAIFMYHSFSYALYGTLMEEVYQVSEWVLVNRLSLNIDITSYMMRAIKKLRKKGKRLRLV